jgi:hypothetical protein
LPVALAAADPVFLMSGDGPVAVHYSFLDSSFEMGNTTAHAAFKTWLADVSRGA